MANNKVQLADGTVLLDLTDTTAAASDVASGKYFYTAAGVLTEGTNSGGGGATYFMEDKAGSGSNEISLDIPFTPSVIVYFSLNPLNAGSFPTTSNVRLLGVYVSGKPRQFYSNTGNSTRGNYLYQSENNMSFSNGVLTVGSTSVKLLASQTYRFIAIP